MSSKGPDFKNDSLKAGLSRWKSEQKRPEQAPKTAARPAPPQPARQREERSAVDDESLFQLAMEDVARIDKRGRPVAAGASPSAAREREDAEALAALSELVAEGNVGCEREGRSLRGRATGVDPALVAHLTAGHFEPGQQTDLKHAGPKFRDEAERALGTARRSGLRCARLLLATGSWDEPAASVWEPRLRELFTRPAVRRIVLAWASVDADHTRVIDVVLRS